MIRRHLVVLICFILAAFNTSCGLLHPPQRQNGYLVAHYTSCGPEALEVALADYAAKHGIKYKRAWNKKELSIEIQDRSKRLNLREFLILLDKQAAAITWPTEIKDTLNIRGIIVKEIDSIDELDRTVDVAIILVHKKGTITWYHWLAYPRDTVYHYGDDTVVDKIFVLIPKS